MRHESRSAPIRCREKPAAPAFARVLRKLAGVTVLEHAANRISGRALISGASDQTQLGVQTINAARRREIF
jgi:hypothetical protein